MILWLCLLNGLHWCHVRLSWTKPHSLWEFSKNDTGVRNLHSQWKYSTVWTNEISNLMSSRFLCPIIFPSNSFDHIYSLLEKWFIYVCVSNSNSPVSIPKPLVNLGWFVHIILCFSFSRVFISNKPSPLFFTENQLSEVIHEKMLYSTLLSWEWSTGLF